MHQSTDDFIRFRCPCGVKLKIPAAAAGRRIRCPKCQKTFLAATDQPAAPNPAATPAKAAAAPSRPAPADDNLLSDLLAAESSSEAIQAPPSESKAAKCPNCGSAMNSQTSSCGVCGYTKVVAPKQAAGGQKKSQKAAKVAGGLALGTGKFMVGTICSFIGALIGAIIWLGVAWITEISFGPLAWLVGILAGVGMRFGYRNENVRAGLVAALMTFVGVIVGQVAVFAVVVVNELGSVDMEWQREYVTEELTEKILDERKAYARSERHEQWDDAHQEAVDRVAAMDDDEVKRLYGEDDSLADLLDFSLDHSEIAYHRTERRIQKEGIDSTDRRQELYYEEEFAKVKSMSREQIAAAKAEIDAWEAGEKWDDPDYVRESLVNSIANELQEDSGGDDEDYDDGSWYKEWETHRKTAKAQVEAMAEEERLERAKKLQSDDEERRKKFLASLDVSSNGESSVGSTLVGGALILAFFFAMFGIFNTICVILAVFTAYKVASGGG